MDIIQTEQIIYTVDFRQLIMIRDDVNLIGIRARGEKIYLYVYNKLKNVVIMLSKYVIFFNFKKEKMLLLAKIFLIAQIIFVELQGYKQADPVLIADRTNLFHLTTDC